MKLAQMFKYKKKNDKNNGKITNIHKRFTVNK